MPNTTQIAVPRFDRPASRPATPSPADWRHGLPQLNGRVALLRELQTADGADLLPLISAPEVVRFLSPPPASLERFAGFISNTAQERAAGRYAAFAIVPHGQTSPVGLVQLRQLEPGFRTAEWGIAIGSAWWGRGLFSEAGALALAFAFEQLGVSRLEARVAARNARGNAAVEKLGGVAEGLLRQSLLTVDGVRVDQILWSWLKEDWYRSGGLHQCKREDPTWVH